MFDTSRALADMASQVRACRSSDGLTLQQLAARSGVAASTIHKVEAQQMVPTVAVFLKIAKGLGRRPQDLIRDIPTNTEATAADAHPSSTPAAVPSQATMGQPVSTNGSVGLSPRSRPGSNAKREVGVWRLHLSAEKMLPTLDLHPMQRAILLVEQGVLDLQAGDQRVQMDAGDCLEVEGERIQSRSVQPESASVILIVSPPGNLDLHLGAPTSTAPDFS